MNGRLDKVAMTARIMKMKTGLYEKTWYPEWDDRQRGPANRILTNVLEVLDEYWEYYNNYDQNTNQRFSSHRHSIRKRND